MGHIEYSRKAGLCPGWLTRSSKISLSFFLIGKSLAITTNPKMRPSTLLIPLICVLVLAQAISKFSLDIRSVEKAAREKPCVRIHAKIISTLDRRNSSNNSLEK